jgi:hypothetical protein
MSYWTYLINFSSLFDGTLGKVPGTKVHLELKPNFKPFCSQAYKIPQSIFKITSDKVEELCCIGVLEPNVYSEWGAPCLFRAKKNGGVKFLTDLCQLNKCLICKPVHLPFIDEVIWKVQGFTFATCLDLNRGYYHFPFITSNWMKFLRIFLALYCHGALTYMLACCRDLCHPLIFLRDICLKSSMILKTL